MKPTSPSPWHLRRHFFKSLPKIARDVFIDTCRQMQQAQIFMVASSLAYTTLLSLIPLLAVSFSVFKAFGGMDKLYRLLEPIILENLAEGTGETVIQTLHSFIDHASTAAVGIWGMIGLIFTSMSMLASIEKAINHVWQTKINRTFFQRISNYWVFITLGPMAISIAIGIATSNDFPVTRLFPDGSGLILIGISFFFGIYKWVPHAAVRWEFALISALITSLLWDLARIGYLIYIKNAVSYSTVYGSLAAIPLLLIWIDILWVVILAGAALTAALQKQTSNDKPQSNPA